MYKCFKMYMQNYKQYSRWRNLYKDLRTNKSEGSSFIDTFEPVCKIIYALVYLHCDASEMQATPDSFTCSNRGAVRVVGLNASGGIDLNRSSSVAHSYTMWVSRVWPTSHTLTHVVN